jgi:peptide/nickel transport system substrate-binding protein
VGRLVSGVLLVLVVLVNACAPAGPASPSSARPAASGAERDAGRTLQLAVKLEPEGMAPKVLVGQNNTRTARRLVSAYLTIKDDNGLPRAYLADMIPQLGTDSWRVNPDSTMETTYRLHPGLTWHDGTPLTAADFVFAWHVYTDPQSGLYFVATPQDQMADVSAPDDRTILIRWRSLYPDAGALDMNDFPALPRHILESPFLADKGEAFMNHGYWNREYVGLGPFRLVRWEPGAAMELEAFANHVGGRPRVDRISLRWIADPNTALAALLAGGLHVATNNAIDFEQGRVLRQAWASSGGQVLVNAREVRFIQVQFSPQFNATPALLNPQVRKALTHALDKPALVEGLLAGEGQPAETLVAPQMPYFQTLLNSIARYPYDPRAAEQLMNQAGFARGADGWFADASGAHFNPEFRAFAGGQEEKELAIMVDGLRRSGMDVGQNVVPAVYSRDVQIRASFTALQANVTQLPERTVFQKLYSTGIPTATNRWSGFNRGGWADPEFDRLTVAFDTTLDRAERDKQMIRMMTIVGDVVPVIPLYYNLDAVAVSAPVTGPTTSAPDTTREWNVQDWRWTS